MYIKCEKGPDGIVIRTGFDKFDPENESLRQVVIDSIENETITMTEDPNTADEVQVHYIEAIKRAGGIP